MYFSEPSINIASPVVSSKLATLKKCNHFDENTAKNGKRLEGNTTVVSRKGNYLIYEDLKESQGINIIGAQVGKLNDEKECPAEDDVSHCVLKMIPYFLIKKKDPILVGVEVMEGTAKIGTPLCIPSRDSIYVGRIVFIENYYLPMNCDEDDNTSVNCAGKGEQVMVEIACEANVEQPKILQRQARSRDEFVSCNRRAA